MINPQADDAFARQLVQLRTASAEQIAAARAEQGRLAQAGEEVALAEILVRQGAISSEIRENVEKLIGVRAASINALGQYSLMKKLGEGGMGTVYLAEDTVSKRKVALKVLPKRFSSDNNVLARFQREAKSTAKLNHENIVGAYATGEDKGYHYFVMEFCEGEALDKKIKRKGFLPWDRSINIAYQTACGLKHAHDHGIIHRDVKPANLCILTNGTVKILDMGLSKNLDAEGSSFNTQSGAVLGTPHYLSPEQAIGDKKIDGRTDIYSLGATLYNMVTGQTPFQGSSSAIVMMKHINEQLPNPQDIREDIPDSVVMVIQKMMAKAPDDRYRNCDDLIADLALVLAGKLPKLAPLEDFKSSIALPKVVRKPNAPAARRRQTGGYAAHSPDKSPTPSAAAKSRTLLYAGVGAGAVLLVAAIYFALPGEKPDTRIAAPVRSLTASTQSVATSEIKPVETEQEKFAKWVKMVQALPLGDQWPAVRRRLVETNPGYDGNAILKTAGDRIIQVQILDHLVHDLSALAALNGLTSLVVEDQLGRPPQISAIKDLSPLKNLPLKSLALSYSTVSDLKPISSLPLNYLSIANTDVSDLTPLQNSASLTELDVRGSKITSLEPLRGLKLTTVNCEKTSVKSLEPLRGMPLRRVLARGTNVTSLAPLAGLMLDHLDIPEKVTDLSALKECSARSVSISVVRDAEAAKALLQIPMLEKINGISRTDFAAKFLAPAAVADAATTAPPAPSPPQPPPPTPTIAPTPPPPPEAPPSPDSFIAVDLSSAFNAEFISTYGHVYDPVTQFMREFNFEYQGWQKSIGRKEIGLPDSGRIEIPEAKGNFYQLCTAPGRNAINVTALAGNQPRPVAVVLPPSKSVRCSKLALLHAGAGFGTLRLQLRYDSGPTEELRLTVQEVRSTGPIPAEHLSIAASISNHYHVNFAFALQSHMLPADPKRTLRALTFAIDSVDKTRSSEADFRDGVFAVSLLPAAAAGIAAPAENAQPKVPDDVDDVWVKSIQGLPAKEQLAKVIERLKDLNPGFSGVHTSKEEANQIAELAIQSEAIENIAPIRALARLRRFECSGLADPEKGVQYSKLLDLSPLKKLNLLSRLNVSATAVEDLSPLKGLTLSELDVSHTLVRDLLPLKGIPLRSLNISNTSVSSLTPLQGMKLDKLNAFNSGVADLALIKQLSVRELNVSRTPIATIAPLANTSLESLDISATKVPPDEGARLATLPLKVLTADDSIIEDISQTLKLSHSLAQINGLTMPEFRFKYPDILVQENFERFDLQRLPPGWTLTDKQAFSVVEKRGRGKVLCINSKIETSGTPSLEIPLDAQKLKGRTLVLSALAICPGGFTAATPTDRPMVNILIKLTGVPKAQDYYVALEPGVAHYDWMPLKLNIPVPGNATGMTLGVRVIHIPVEVFFDDLKLELVPIQAPARK